MLSGGQQRGGGWDGLPGALRRRGHAGRCAGEGRRREEEPAGRGRHAALRRGGHSGAPHIPSTAHARALAVNGLSSAHQVCRLTRCVCAQLVDDGEEPKTLEGLEPPVAAGATLKLDVAPEPEPEAEAEAEPEAEE